MKIVVDSACDLTDEMIGELGVKLEKVPFNLQLDNDHYVDDEDLDLNSFIDKMNISQVVKTSAPAPELFLEKFKGVESVFVITISAKVSASYNNALLAKQMYFDEFGEKFIHVFDSATACAGETLTAIKLAELIRENLSENEVVKKMNEIISETVTYFALEKYDNLVKNGRMSGMVAKIGNFLSIKPIGSAVEGRTEMVDKAMGTQKALLKVIDKIVSAKVDFGSRTLAINHVRCLEKAEWFKSEIMKHVKFKRIIIVPTNGLCSVYSDDQGLVAAY